LQMCGCVCFVRFAGNFDSTGVAIGGDGAARVRRRAGSESGGDAQREAGRQAEGKIQEGFGEAGGAGRAGAFVPRRAAGSTRRDA